MKKFIAMLFVVCIVFSLCACGSSGGSGESLTFATGGESGTYYAFGSVLAQYVSNNTDIKITAVVGNGSQANVEDLDSGAVQLGFCQSDVMSYAYSGTNLFAESGAVDSFSVAAALYMEQVQIVTTNPDIKTVGLLYSNSEANSATPIAEAKAYLQEKQIDFVEKTGNTSGEIVEAAASMVGRVDAVFTPTDNVVMAAEVTVAETLNEAGIPHYTGADSFVAAGAFATCGVNYTELGTYTADMAMDILPGGAVPEFHVMDGGIITVNTETAAILGIDYSVFSSMANTVVEVKTGE